MIRNHRAYPYLIQHRALLIEEITNRLLNRGPLDLRELFDYKNFNGTDLYHPVVFRSTKKQSSEMPEEITSEEVFGLDKFDETLAKDENGKIKMSPEEYAEKISIEVENMSDDLFLHYHEILPFLRSHEYSSLAKNDEPTPEYEKHPLLNHERVSEITGRLMNYQVDPLGQGNFKFGDFENDKGYYIPEYNSLRWNSAFLNEEYDKIKEEFDVNNESLKASALVGGYRDVLAKQIDRQIEQLNDANDAFLDVISFFYINVEKNIRKVRFSLDESSLDDFKESYIQESAIEKDWLYIFSTMREIYDTFYLNNDDEEILEHHEETISAIPYANEELKDNFIMSMHHFNAKKKPILEVARKLALKTTICESILEDLLMDEPIKTFNEFSESFEIRLTKDDIIARADNLKKNGMSVKLMFEYMKKWLFIDLGFNNDYLDKHFGFQLEDPHHFNRFVNKNISNKNRNE